MGAEKDLQKDLEKVKQQGVGYYRLKEGDEIYRVLKNSDGSVKQIIRGTLEEIIVDFNGNDRQFVKRIKISGYDKEFNPNKNFKRFYFPIENKEK